MNLKTKNRIYFNRFSFVIICLLAIIALFPFFHLVIKLLSEGVKNLSLNFFIQNYPSNMDATLSYIAGESIRGGILSGILGSFYMALITIIIAVPLGITAGIFIHDNRNHLLSNALEYSIHILHGVPSIIVGIIIYLWVVKSLHSFSILAGGISLSFIMLPVLIKNTIRILAAIPSGLRENAFALGYSYPCVMCRVLIPSVKKELTSSVLITLSQTIGEVAPLLYTALGASVVSWNINEPGNSLSLIIWEFFNKPYMIGFMWSTALILFLLIVGLNITAKAIVRKNRIYGK